MVWKPYASLKALVNTFVVLFLYMHLIKSAAVSNRSQKLNLTLSESGDRHCTDSPEWIGTGAQLDDCVAAVRMLHDTELNIYGDLDVEFYSFDKTKARSTLSRPTPIKYTHATCTLAIVMLSFFTEGELPGLEDVPIAHRDFTSFNDLYQLAIQLGSTCLLSGRAGWAADGGRESIGVMLWATNSAENRRVPLPRLVRAIGGSKAPWVEF